jgi:leucyl-tRNA synthetase
MVIQYRVHDKDKPQQVQIFAINVVTHEPMEGHKNVFLVPADDEKQIEDRTAFLMDKYAK